MFHLSPASSQGATSYASSACAACKIKKRKCDKTLPSCSLCRRTGNSCGYQSYPDDISPAVHASQLNTPTFQSEQYAQRDTLHIAAMCRSHEPHNGSPFSTAFLDIDAFKRLNLQLPKPAIGIPMKVLAILNRGCAAVDATEAYFRTIHRWFPVISKKRLDLGVTLRNPGPDLAMLFLAIKLIVMPVNEEETHHVYAAAKDFMASLQTAGATSLPCLQAMTLVALFEYSHAIYPAAWLTVGACARSADLLGLDARGDRLNVIEKCVSWTEMEERRRVWWAIFVLDRMISLPSGRSHAVDELNDSSLLSVDDAIWDSGQAQCAVYSAVSTSNAVAQGAFTRLCQSAVLVGRAAAVRRKQLCDISGSTNDTRALADEICSFVECLESSDPDNTDLALFGPRCLAWSALFALLDKHCCPEKLSSSPGYRPMPGLKTSDEQALQRQAIGMLRASSLRILREAKVVQSLAEPSAFLQYEVFGNVCPLALDAIYCAMMMFQWFHHESGDDEASGNLQVIRGCLKAMGDRWRLASEYLVLEKTQDMGSLSQQNIALEKRELSRA